MVGSRESEGKSKSPQARFLFATFSFGEAKEKVGQQSQICGRVSALFQLSSLSRIHKKYARRNVRRIFYDRAYKPGSVIDSHLSRRTVAGTLQPPSRKQPGKPCFLCGVAPDRVYSDGRFRTPSGALLPHLSTLAGGSKRRSQRYISVALFLRSLWAGVTRYPCPAEPGLSSCAAFRRCARDCPARSLRYCTLFA